MAPSVELIWSLLVDESQDVSHELGVDVPVSDGEN